MLITRAPCDAAQLMPSTIAESLPLPLACSTLTGRMRAFHATPAIPRESLVLAAMMPATIVPW